MSPSQKPFNARLENIVDEQLTASLAAVNMLMKAVPELLGEASHALRHGLDFSPGFVRTVIACYRRDNSRTAISGNCITRYRTRSAASYRSVDGKVIASHDIYYVPDSLLIGGQIRDDYAPNRPVDNGQSRAAECAVGPIEFVDPITGIVRLVNPSQRAQKPPVFAADANSPKKGETVYSHEGTPIGQALYGRHVGDGEYFVMMRPGTAKSQMQARAYNLLLQGRSPHSPESEEVRYVSITVWASI